MMTTITLSEILNDIRAAEAEDGLHVPFARQNRYCRLAHDSVQPAGLRGFDLLVVGDLPAPIALEPVFRFQFSESFVNVR